MKRKEENFVIFDIELKKSEAKNQDNWHIEKEDRSRNYARKICGQLKWR